ncbi:helix-turn-helix domain-containing protein [Nocardia testacea]|uniref:helix-turn-helix domain-containing protein n=1 Tax=Nocardia testacea TaxID=248551 RepID=UPI003C2AD035
MIGNTSGDTRRARNLISVRTAAALIDVDAKTIRNWIAAGDLSGFRVNGRLIRVERDELLGLVRPALLSDDQGGVQ